MIIDSENENQSQVNTLQITARRAALRRCRADSFVRTSMILSASAALLTALEPGL
jgi:hypothetical protein